MARRCPFHAPVVPPDIVHDLETVGVGIVGERTADLTIDAELIPEASGNPQHDFVAAELPGRGGRNPLGPLALQVHHRIVAQVTARVFVAQLVLPVVGGESERATHAVVGAGKCPPLVEAGKGRREHIRLESLVLVRCRPDASERKIGADGRVDQSHAVEDRVAPRLTLVCDGRLPEHPKRQHLQHDVVVHGRRESEPGAGRGKQRRGERLGGQRRKRRLLPKRSDRRRRSGQFLAAAHRLHGEHHQAEQRRQQWDRPQRRRRPAAV